MTTPCAIISAKKISGRTDELNTYKKAVLTGRSLASEPCKVQLAFITKEGVAYGGVVILQPQRGDYTLDLNKLEPVRMVTLPRPYPTFLPYYFENTTSSFNIQSAETIQISIGPGMDDAEKQRSFEIGIERVWLE